MKSTKSLVRGRTAQNTVLPVPNQEFHITDHSSPSSLSSGLGAAAGGQKTSAPDTLDEQSAEFYQQLCLLYNKSKVNPVIAIHAVELFTQSLKRAERARLGVPNPEDTRVQP